jgi:UDP-N-acetylglucosamine--N-acetylmuramyl-(pentapeptide) pyrophosphoryl-undecaprenol N-acetylglucosamine transferase
MTANKSIVIAGGGTGGHVYPALAIALAVKEKNPSALIHFVGTTRGIESRLVPQHGYPLHVLPVGGLKGTSLIGRLKVLFLMPLAVIKSFRILLKLKPDAVIGVGGFASGPFVLIASLFGYRTAIWEPNAQPGLTNRILGKFVDRAFIVFENAARAFKKSKVTFVGMPVRKGFSQKTRPSHSTLRILVTGGSQGARGINKVISEAVIRGGTWSEGVELVHQTGRLDIEWAREKYKSAPPGFSVLPYLDDMEARFEWADLVFSRSGASTVAELAASQKCAVLIPFPWASDNHQQKNAESLVEKQAALMVLQDDFTVERFIAIVEDFKKNRDKITFFERNISAFHRPLAAEFIAAQLLV